ncbi:MAG: hypothetical protein U5K33_08760 [Halofilum sp. (in: g-proteobacteria)]|nr:hypothetical protein [Halofilum sp. (in: g-proteobacteria)]
MASNADSGDRFGAALALSGAGDLLVVGAPREDSNATGVDGNAGNDGQDRLGAAYQFQLQGSSWTEMDYIKASNTDANDFFGGSITLSDDGNVLAVGAGGEASNATGIDGNQDDEQPEPGGRSLHLY